MEQSNGVNLEKTYLALEPGKVARDQQSEENAHLVPVSSNIDLHPER